MKNKKLLRFLTPLLILPLVLFIGGCRDKDAGDHLEDAGEDMQDAAESLGDAAEEAYREAEEAINDY